MRVVAREVLACGTIRYRFENGWFADKARHLAHFSMGYRVGVWEPGAGELVETAKVPYRIAAFRGGGDSLKAALRAVKGA